MKLKRRNLIWMVSLSVILLAAVAAIFNQHLSIDTRQRESHFISLHYLAMEASREMEIAFEDDPPSTLDELMETYAGVGKNSWLMKPFPDGLIYHVEGYSFTLEEPEARWVSLFRRDRIVGSGSQWPKWEVSGKWVRKFEGQVVPPAGFPSL
ncbi:MAG: hypothetical protein V4689_01700 [Verrucomicrobiota bacterium]